MNVFLVCLLLSCALYLYEWSIRLTGPKAKHSYKAMFHVNVGGLRKEIMCTHSANVFISEQGKKERKESHFEKLNGFNRQKTLVSVNGRDNRTGCILIDFESEFQYNLVDFFHFLLLSNNFSPSYSSTIHVIILTIRRISQLFVDLLFDSSSLTRGNSDHRYRY